MKTLITSLCLLTSIGVSGRVEATTIHFVTSVSEFDPGTPNHGWWSATRSANDSNDNYSTGEFFNGVSSDILRSFFSFDLSTLDLSGQTLLSATFGAVRYTYSSADATETIAFFDVSTDAATLNNNTGTSAGIFADLGGGSSYGSFVVPAYPTSTTLHLLFLLNPAALTDIAAAAGGFFSIGGSLQSIIPGGASEGIFTVSGDADGFEARLTLETEPQSTAVPEPASLLLVGTGLVGAGARRWRKRRKTAS